MSAPLGITSQGKKEILGLYIDDSEGASFYRTSSKDRAEDIHHYNIAMFQRRDKELFNYFKNAGYAST